MARRVAGGIAVLASLLTLSATPAAAVEVNPLRVELTGKPGETISASLTITNHRPETVRIRAQAGAYRYSFSAHTRPPTDPSAQRLPSCESWIATQGQEWSLGPAAAGALEFTVTIPQDTEQSAAGEYVAALLVDELPLSTDTSAGAGQGAVTVVPRIAIPVYLFLEGRDTPQGRVTDFVAQSGSQAGVVRLILTLANDGRVHLRPTGTVLVTNDRGEIVQRSALGRTIPIFPKFAEGIPIWVPPLSAGRYKAVATVELGGDQLLQRDVTFNVSADGRVT